MSWTRICCLGWAIANTTLASAGQTPAPIVEWQRSLGGSSNDFLFAVSHAPQRGYLLGGFSNSQTNGTKTAPLYGANDYWVIRLDPQWQPLWEHSFGGTADDFLQVCRWTADGGVILGGTSLSGADGNKQSPNAGLRDYWVVRLGADGNKLWEQSAGGNGSDYLQDLAETPDGGFLLGGYSFSAADGNKTSPTYGFLDYWIVRLGPTGNKLWERSYGGTSSDYLVQIQLATNGGFALGGYSQSDVGGNRTSPRIGGLDFWFLLIDTNGNKTFEAAFGGAADDVLLSMMRTADGGFILGGSSASSPGGTKSSPLFGQNDFWIVRLTAEGAPLWDRSYGGTGQDVLRTMCEWGGHRLILAGWSDSPNNGSKTSPAYGKSDYWVVTADAQGHQLSDQSYGGAEDEVVLASQPPGDSEVLLGGYSFSPAQNLRTAPHFGGADFWLLKVIEPNSPPVPHLLSLSQSINDIESAGFKFILLGQSNRSYALEYSSDLTHWVPFATNVPIRPETQIVDPSLTNQRMRFYRAILQP